MLPLSIEKLLCTVTYIWREGGPASAQRREGRVTTKVHSPPARVVRAACTDQVRNLVQGRRLVISRCAEAASPSCHTRRGGRLELGLVVREGVALGGRCEHDAVRLLAQPRTTYGQLRRLARPKERERMRTEMTVWCGMNCTP